MSHVNRTVIKPYTHWHYAQSIPFSHFTFTIHHSLTCTMACKRQRSSKQSKHRTKQWSIDINILSRICVHLVQVLNVVYFFVVPSFSLSKCVCPRRANATVQQPPCLLFPPFSVSNFMIWKQNIWHLIVCCHCLWHAFDQHKCKMPGLKWK